jgi:hypothetical protein
VTFTPLLLSWHSALFERDRNDFYCLKTNAYIQFNKKATQDGGFAARNSKSTANPNGQSGIEDHAIRK